MSEISGSCLCRAVAYSLAEKPLRTTICYCKFCQRATGGTEMILPVSPKPDFEITRGTPKSFAQISEGSGKEVRVHFCDTCGTKLYVTWERWPDMVGLYGGTLDDPTVIDLEPANTKQIFAASARPGTIFRAGIPTFWEHATTLQGEPLEPFVLAVPTAVEDL